MKTDSEKEMLKTIIESDTAPKITEYIDYKTTLKNEEGSKIELLLGRLSLCYLECSFALKDNSIEIIYNTTYQKFLQDYKDENYIKEAMIHSALVLFVTVEDL